MLSELCTCMARLTGYKRKIYLGRLRGLLRIALGESEPGMHCYVRFQKRCIKFGAGKYGDFRRLVMGSADFGA